MDEILTQEEIIRIKRWAKKEKRDEWLYKGYLKSMIDKFAEPSEYNKLNNADKARYKWMQIRYEGLLVNEQQIQ